MQQLTILALALGVSSVLCQNQDGSWHEAAAAKSSAHNWVVRQTVLAPDGYPRSAITVIDRTQEVVSGPLASTWLPDVEQEHNNRVEYTGNAGNIPGPTLRVRQGETVTISVTNELTEDISVHWHGLHQMNQAWQDGTAGITQCGIGPKETYTYQFNITQEPGTHWYHSHVGAQTADGLQGMIVILPAEGEVDPIQQLTPYDEALDQELMVSDWAHESSQAVGTRYLTRIGTFEQVVPKDQVNKYDEMAVADGDEQEIHDKSRAETDVREEFLPDYPWPSSYVLLQGRGQTSCKTMSYASCEEVREVGWPHFLNHSNPPTKDVTRDSNTGQLIATFGQCSPERSSFFGRCIQDADPARLQCRNGKSARFRLLNSGYSMPLRFWFDRHTFTVVSRDGHPVEPNGPHKLITLPIGQRIDVVVNCDQDDTQSYKLFAQVALYEFYTGAQINNFQAHSYAVLEYSRNANLTKTLLAPEWDPDRDFPSAAAGTDTSKKTTTYYRNKYADWGCPSGEHIPTHIEYSLKPLATKEFPATGTQSCTWVGASAGSDGWCNSNCNADTPNCPESSCKCSGGMQAPAADGGQILVSSQGNGNWWNNMNASLGVSNHKDTPNVGASRWSQRHELTKGGTKDYTGLNYEWWTAIDGDHYTNTSGPLHTPVEPVLQGKMMGRNFEALYEGAPELPLVERMEYNADSPKTYQLILINWESQQHPWHLHGHTIFFLGEFWLDPEAKHSGRARLPGQAGGITGTGGQYFNESYYRPAMDEAGVPALGEAGGTPVLGDSFTIRPYSFVVMRITANNPGAWLFHCHMDPHLEAGMGFIISTEDANGQYPLPEPPSSYPLCASPETTFAAYKQNQALAPASFLEAAATNMIPDSSDNVKVAMLVTIVGVMMGALGVLLGRTVLLPEKHRVKTVNSELIGLPQPGAQRYDAVAQNEFSGP